MSGHFVLEIRPVGNACDRHCTHCYQVVGKTVTSVLPVSALRESLVGLRRYLTKVGFDTVTFVFHGGEPLMVGTDWLVEAYAAIVTEFRGFRVRVACHTHGFHELEVVRALLDRDVAFGVSIVVPSGAPFGFEDIPPVLLEAYRQKRLASIQVVITADWGARQEAFVALLSRLPANVNVKVIPCMGVSGRGDLVLQPMAYLGALLSLSQRLEGSEVWSRLFLEPVSWCRGMGNGKRFYGCRFTTACSLKNGRIVTAAVDADGGVYACNRFAAARVLALGHTSAGDWIGESQLVLNEIRRSYDRHSARHQCRSCAAFLGRKCIGTGGCPFHAMICFGTYAEDPYCRGEAGLVRFYEGNPVQMDDLKRSWQDLITL